MSVPEEQHPRWSRQALSDTSHWRHVPDLKVAHGITSYENPGWYPLPPARWSGSFIATNRRRMDRGDEVCIPPRKHPDPNTATEGLRPIE